MHRGLALAAVLVAALLVAVQSVAAQPAPVGYAIVNATGYTALASSNASTLYSVDGAFGYDWPVYLIDLHGSRWQQGYDYGLLLGQNVTEISLSLLSVLVSPDPLEQAAVREFCLWQWAKYLSRYLPAEFGEELAGVAAGGAAAGFPDTGDLVAMVATLANFPGTTSDLKYILEQELLDAATAAERAMLRHMLAVTVKRQLRGFGCSMAAVWGSRTDTGALYSHRNLDWTPNTGAAKVKLVTVFHPPGARAHATFGFSGFFGALAGLSASGLTVHEANLEEGKDITFDGFPWVFRLRYIMEQAGTLGEALDLWAATKNTVGFNHGIMSQADVVPGVLSHAGVVIETNANESVVFYDNSPVEAAAKIVNAAGQTVQYGFPLPEAVWRTNAPYSPVMRASYSWAQSISSNSQLRYMLIHDGIVAYEVAGVPIGISQFVNITAITGQKGEQAPAGNPYLCPPAGQGTPDGSNILSVVNAPGINMSFVAWGNSEGSSWRAACCNTYVGIDLGKFW